jgi:hypothetical protein
MVSNVPLKLFVKADAILVIVTGILVPVSVQALTLSADVAKLTEADPELVTAVVTKVAAPEKN